MRVLVQSDLANLGKFVRFGALSRSGVLVLLDSVYGRSLWGCDVLLVGTDATIDSLSFAVDNGHAARRAPNKGPTVSRVLGPQVII